MKPWTLCLGLILMTLPAQAQVGSNSCLHLDRAASSARVGHDFDAFRLYGMYLDLALFEPSGRLRTDLNPHLSQDVLFLTQNKPNRAKHQFIVVNLEYTPRETQIQGYEQALCLYDESGDGMTCVLSCEGQNQLFRLTEAPNARVRLTKDGKLNLGQCSREKTAHKAINPARDKILFERRESYNECGH